tara:strand:- start:16 stop:678 length:663 start_codon:yes stop_codon:yes gene_type:complete
MHKTIYNLNNIKNSIKTKIIDIKKKNTLPKIIAISKTFKIEYIMPLIDHGHADFGENKVQEAESKWRDIKISNKNIKLHLVGKLQTNKVKLAVNLFDFIHSLDSEKLAKKLADEQKKQNKKPKFFIQINIGNEETKSGIQKEHLLDYYNYCVDLNLEIIGTMCIPPEKEEPSTYFSEMVILNKKLNLNELSMGMSSDYIKAVEYNSTYLRIGSKIFGERF